MQKAQQRLSQFGVECLIDPQCRAEHHQSAGTPEDKLNALMRLNDNQEVDAVIAAKGGNRSALLLDLMERHAPPSPITKPLIGFSDVTGLLNGIIGADYAAPLFLPIHGPCFESFGDERISDDHIQALLNLLRAIKKKEQLDQSWSESEQNKTDIIEGFAIGGNMSAFQSMLGTPSFNRFLALCEGKAPEHLKQHPFILCLEDIGDDLSRYDRMFQHIRRSGLLERCSTVMLGDITPTPKEESEAREAVPFGFSLAECLEDAFGDLPWLKVIENAPFGHRGAFYPLPLGVHISLKIAGHKAKGYFISADSF
jgi:muramoyltetrapeptide carboxypeptidase